MAKRRHVKTFLSPSMERMIYKSHNEKMAARYIINQMLKEAEKNLFDLRRNDRSSFNEIVAVYKQDTGAKGNISVERLAKAEVDMIICSGDALRDWLSGFEGTIVSQWTGPSWVSRQKYD